MTAGNRPPYDHHWAIGREGGSTAAIHAIGLGSALAIHAAIIGYVATNRTRARAIADVRPR